MQERLDFDRVYLPPYLKQLVEETLKHMRNAGMDTSELEEQLPELRLYVPYHYDSFYFTEDRLRIPDQVYKVKMDEIALPPDYKRWGAHYLSLYMTEGKITEVKID